MYDIVAIGECLIDMFSRVEDGKIQIEGNPGGAPANVLAAASRLGMKTAFIGKAGSDSFGQFLKSVLEEAGIDVTSFVLSPNFLTSLAIVSLDQTGNRSFAFYRNNTADVNLQADDIDPKLIKSTKIFHFGSVSLTQEPSRSATFAAVRAAKENHCLISYDPNLRESLWNSAAEAKKVILQGLALADIVKLSEEELVFLTETDDTTRAMSQLQSEFHFPFLAVTMGPRGCCCQVNGNVCCAPAFDVPCVDTTGAGDAFMGALLSRIIQINKKFSDYTEDDLTDLTDFLNAAGSLATTKKGAIPAMPGEAEIRRCMKEVPLMKQ